MVEKITPRSEDYSRWYTDIIQEAELADYAPVKGCMVIRPYGYAIWENIKEALDKRFKETGHVNAYFPLFIPMGFMQKEAEHVEGFAPQLAVVTHGGGKKLEEPLVVRPTSETIINSMFAKWVKSYRDLPILINQWCNVVRWEMRTRLFLRTLEFLWQEGHTAHATAVEAEEEARRMLDVYIDFAENDASIPVIPGRKSESEKFAGAVTSYSIEAMMGDKRALQSATSHFLGQKFAKAFGIQYLDKNNELQYVWQTSWGLSTRFIGAIVMVHGDDQGLILPPKLAPIQVVIVPIWKGEEEKEGVMGAVKEVAKALGKRFRYKVDDREERTPGWKFNYWEMKGVPLRLEIGPKEVAEGQALLARRDTREKIAVSREGLSERVSEILDDVQRNLFRRAKKFLDDNTYRLEDYGEFKRIIEEKGGFIYAPWCGDASCEEAIQSETKATSRCIPFEQSEKLKRCVYCGREAREEAVFAKAY
jgi:prolyl-tRNA synthetase